MAEKGFNFFRNNAFSFSTFIVLLGYLVTHSKWVQKVDSHLVDFNNHKANQTLHMPFESRIKLFVPRTELDSRLKNIEQLLHELNKQLKYK
jgi:hypothetical protein